MTFTIISFPQVGPDHLSVFPDVEPLNIFLSLPGEDHLPVNFRSFFNGEHFPFRNSHRRLTKSLTLNLKYHCLLCHLNWSAKILLVLPELKFSCPSAILDDIKLMKLLFCVNEFFNVPGILFYSVPVGHSTDNGNVTYHDTPYNGVTTKGVLKDGTGILTDGKFGPDDAKQDKGEGWVGWSQEFTTSPYIDITFEFSDVRMFKNVTLTVNADKKRGYAVFSRSKIFFALAQDNFIKAAFLQFYPRNFADNNSSNSTRHITLPLCENTARFIKLRLYFGGRWLLITEISFNSGIFFYIISPEIIQFLFLVKANLCILNAPHSVFNIVSVYQ